VEIIQPSAKMVSHGDPTQPFTQDEGIALLRRVEYFGRISHRSEESQTEGSWERFIQSVVLGHGDYSIIEHCTVTVDAEVDRGITHEWVRHRIGAYTQESTRFVNLQKKGLLRFIVPSLSSEIITENMLDAYRIAERIYVVALESGASPQLARSVLPNALASRILVTYNLRMWRHFFLMRTTKETHPQFREVTIPLLEEFQAKIPLLYADIVPLSKQSENLRMPR
jgi:thymidylate synthase (FAD)